MRSIVKKIIWLTLFSLSMAYLETAVVVYLRIIYYPQGFQFPLQPLSHNVSIIEVFREMATLLMLLSVGIISGKNATQRFAFFIFCFAVWDIFYYVFLKILLGWPSSFFSADILFLIPVPWVGPVIAPCIVSISMILLALSLLLLGSKGYTVNIKRREWLIYITGSLVVIFSFLWDYLKYRYTTPSPQTVSIAGSDKLFSDLTKYIPMGFNWPIFLCGEGLLIYGMIVLIKRILSQKTDRL